MIYPMARSLLLAALALLATATAQAERADRDKPMNIEADALRYDDKSQTSTFTGRVVLTKGTIVMRGARLEVRQDAAGHQFGMLQADAGQRAFFRQKREGMDEFIEGEAERIEYDSRADTVRLSRRAEMRRYTGATLADEISGALIVYNNATEVYTVDGAAARSGAAGGAQSTGRVRATIGPRQPAAAPAARPASAPLRATPRLSQEARP
ncbi:MAG: lipopolysaccharide transport periplasmic protein LptA [Comamonadaceae bacterium]|nr:lipopolysaccharide transport periplasmic protein LptA [Comamonadaceae bacterium]